MGSPSFSRREPCCHLCEIGFAAEKGVNCAVSVWLTVPSRTTVGRLDVLGPFREAGSSRLRACVADKGRSFSVGLSQVPSVCEHALAWALGEGGGARGRRA